MQCKKMIFVFISTHCKCNAIFIECVYGTDNDTLFNPIKSVCTVFKRKAYKLYLPTVFSDQEELKYIFKSKY